MRNGSRSSGESVVKAMRLLEGVSGTQDLLDVVESYERLVYSLVWGCCRSAGYCELHLQVRNQRNGGLGASEVRRISEALVLFQKLAALRKARIGCDGFW